MFKQMVLIFSAILFLCVFAFAQEQPETTKSEEKECSTGSHSCCTSKESHSEVQMNESKETTELKIWNKVCPVSGEELDSDAITVEYQGKTVGLCCQKCDKKFQKDPETYMKNLNEDGSEFIGS